MSIGFFQVIYSLLFFAASIIHRKNCSVELQIPPLLYNSDQFNTFAHAAKWIALFFSTVQLKSKAVVTWVPKGYSHHHSWKQKGRSREMRLVRVLHYSQSSVRWFEVCIKDTHTFASVAWSHILLTLRPNFCESSPLQYTS